MIQKSYMAVVNSSNRQHIQKQNRTAVSMDGSTKNDFSSAKKYDSSTTLVASPSEEERYKSLVSFPPTDGSYAWMVATGIILGTLLTGLSNCWGIMQDYYLRNKVFDSPHVISQLTMVGNLLQMFIYSFVFFGNILCPFVGVKWLLIIGTSMMSIGLVLSGMATSIWHLYLSLGVCTGIGISIHFAVALRVMAQWFVKRRNTACGIQAATVPFTSLILPFMMTPINNNLGPAWTYIILGIIFFAIHCSAILMVKERLTEQERDAEKKNVLDFSVLKNTDLVIWLMVGPIQLFAQYLVYTFLPSYATYLGLSDWQGATIVTIVSLMNCVGRTGGGVVADKIGPLNTFIIAMIIAMITVWVNWVLAKSFIALIAFAVIFGVVYGCYGPTATGVVLSIIDMKQYYSATSFRMLVFCTCIFGPMIATHVESMNHGEPFFYCKIVTGIGYALCALLSIVLKFRKNRNLFVKI
ncbi:major facilitator superfamily domain-containing protein [Phascolomyces articulosus]|uniref:Major facilitator superfamily domain-containing protein n=1 Tax=Phascolomyces articulosus TaxID=60185 RepID=A0AAD5JXN5_9FUNG|nr:major facilitator superfamily domain-containing protein [Phascolomyces articulosus]